MSLDFWTDQRTRVPRWNISLYTNKPVSLICKCPTVKPPAASAQTWESHHYYYCYYCYYYQKSSFRWIWFFFLWATNTEKSLRFSCFMFQQRTRSDSVDSVWSNRTIVFRRCQTVQVLKVQILLWAGETVDQTRPSEVLLKTDLHILLLIFLWNSRIPLFLHDQITGALWTRFNRS